MHKNEGHPNNNFQICKKINNSHKFCQMNPNKGQLHTGTILFQALQQIKASDGILFSVNTIRCFLGKTAEKYTLQKKSNTLSDAPKSQDIVINEVLETITMTNDNHRDRSEPVHKAAD